MTVLIVDGFESYGDDTSAGADIEALILATNRIDYQYVTGGGHTGGVVELVDDFETLGYALQGPLMSAARGEYVLYEWPDGTGRFPDYRVSTNGSSPDFAAGFRFLNAEISPSSTITTTIFNGMNSASGTAFSLQIMPNGVDLRLVDNDAITYDAVGVLTQGTWHYIEVEWKQTTIGNGPYCKVYVDGNLVIDETNIDLAGFTFFNTWGFRVGWGCSGGNQIDNGNFFSFDDVYGMVLDGVDHTAPLGACRVYAMRPASDESVTFSPSVGGDNYALIDETDQDQTDYVESGVGGDIDKYGLTPLDNVSAVHGVRVDVSCIAIGSATTLAIGLDDGTLDEQSMGSIGTGSVVNTQQVFEEDPSNAAWTEASVEAVQATQKEV